MIIPEAFKLLLELIAPPAKIAPLIPTPPLTTSDPVDALLEPIPPTTEMRPLTWNIKLCSLVVLELNIKLPEEVRIKSANCGEFRNLKQRLLVPAIELISSP